MFTSDPYFVVSGSDIEKESSLFLELQLTWWNKSHFLGYVLYLLNIGVILIFYLLYSQDTQISHIFSVQITYIPIYSIIIFKNKKMICFFFNNFTTCYDMNE